MTPAERRGFRLACAAMELFGHRIAREGVGLGGPAEPLVPRHRLMAHTGRMIAATARTVALTLGRDG
jgi:hypothetical protein